MFVCIRVCLCVYPMSWLFFRIHKYSSVFFFLSSYSVLFILLLLLHVVADCTTLYIVHIWIVCLKTSKTHRELNESSVSSIVCGEGEGMKGQRKAMMEAHIRTSACATLTIIWTALDGKVLYVLCNTVTQHSSNIKWLVNQHCKLQLHWELCYVFFSHFTTLNALLCFFAMVNQHCYFRATFKGHYNRRTWYAMDLIILSQICFLLLEKCVCCLLELKTNFCFCFLFHCCSVTFIFLLPLFRLCIWYLALYF